MELDVFIKENGITVNCEIKNKSSSCSFRLAKLLVFHTEYMVLKNSYMYLYVLLYDKPLHLNLMQGKRAQDIHQTASR